jgi:hypothetical protein
MVTGRLPVFLFEFSKEFSEEQRKIIFSSLSELN